MRSGAAARCQRGFSVIEVVIAAALLGVLGLAAITMTNASRDGARQAHLLTVHTERLLRASVGVREDLEQTATGHMIIATLPDLNHSITLQRPVASGSGAVLWGAYDPSRPAGERLRADCYTRLTVVAGDGGRMLVRQVLDADGNVVHQEVIARGLASGSASTPGLRIVPSGELWRVCIGLAAENGRPGESLTFDVALRN